jgi:hypothetical protein
MIIHLLKVWMRMVNAHYTMRNFALHMVVGWTSSIMWKKKHKFTVENKASNNSISNYWSMKYISEMKKQLSLVFFCFS